MSSKFGLQAVIPVRTSNVTFPQSATDGSTDVGGGSVNNTESIDLAHNALVWMINEAIAAGVGLVFKHDAFWDIPGLQLVSEPAAPALMIDNAGEGNFDSFKTVSNLSGIYDSRDNLMVANETSTGWPSAHGSPSTFNTRTPSIRETSQGPVTISALVNKDVLVDATGLPYDALASKTTFYWLLEWFPIRARYQDADGNWHAPWQYVLLSLVLLNL
jgi:hypothetical protein